MGAIILVQSSTLFELSRQSLETVTVKPV